VAGAKKYWNEMAGAAGPADRITGLGFITTSPVLTPYLYYCACALPAMALVANLWIEQHPGIPVQLQFELPAQLELNFGGRNSAQSTPFSSTCDCCYIGRQKGYQLRLERLL
jgi:hypothetical protein